MKTIDKFRVTNKFCVDNHAVEDLVAICRHYGPKLCWVGRDKPDVDGCYTVRISGDHAEDGYTLKDELIRVRPSRGEQAIEVEDPVVLLA